MSDKQTDLQKLRKALMGQLEKVEEGTADIESVENIIGISSSVVKTYNVELRVNELGHKYGGKDFKEEPTDVFKKV